MKYFVYVLHSSSNNKYYTGMTTNLARRINEHNSGKTKSNKAYIPWHIIYTEEYESKSEAREREKYLKSGSGREYLKQMNFRK